MPCNSDYMNPTNMEVNLSKVYAFLDELDTGKLSDEFHTSLGYDKRVYGIPSKATKSHLDEKVAELCSRLRKVKNVKKYSLEMQMWWRDHQEADRKRELKQNNKGTK